MYVQIEDNDMIEENYEINTTTFRLNHIKYLWATLAQSKNYKIQYI